jgi:hypothetical protein
MIVSNPVENGVVIRALVGRVQFPQVRHSDDAPGGGIDFIDRVTVPDVREDAPANIFEFVELGEPLRPVPRADSVRNFKRIRIEEVQRRRAIAQNQLLAVAGQTPRWFRAVAMADGL